MLQQIVVFRYVWTEWATGQDLQWISKFLLFLPAAFETLATPGIASCLSRWSMKKVTWGGIEETARLSFGSCPHSPHLCTLLGLACCLMNVCVLELSTQSWSDLKDSISCRRRCHEIVGRQFVSVAATVGGFQSEEPTESWVNGHKSFEVHFVLSTWVSSEHYLTFPIELICFSFRSCAHWSAVVEDGVAEVLLPMARWGWAGGSLRGIEKKVNFLQLLFVHSDSEQSNGCDFDIPWDRRGVQHFLVQLLFSYCRV